MRLDHRDCEECGFAIRSKYLLNTDANYCHTCTSERDLDDQSPSTTSDEYLTYRRGALE